MLIAPRSPHPHDGLQNAGLHIGLTIPPQPQPQPHYATGTHPQSHPDLSLITTLSAGHPHPHRLTGKHPQSHPYLSLTKILSAGHPHPQP